MFLVDQVGDQLKAQPVHSVAISPVFEQNFFQLGITVGA
jgi:hypothetical protein